MQYAFLFQFLSKNIKWFLVAGAVLGIYFAFKPLWFRLFGQVPEDAQYQKGGGDVTAAFEANAKNKVMQIRKGIHDDAWLGSDIRCNTFTEMMSYNDNELRLIHNGFKNRYGITLYSDINNVSGDGCSNPFSTEITILIKERLAQLGIV
jgi:hypothetical protein